MIYYDTHTHSDYSSDSTASFRDQIEGAIAGGLKGICFTDHMDIDYPCYEFNGLKFEFDPKQYIEELQKLRAEYEGKIRILFGMEIGLRNEPECVDKMITSYGAMAESYPFDFIIGSVHCLENTDAYYPSPYWDNKTYQSGFTAYLEAVLYNVLHYECYDSLGHLDYIIRYVPEGLCGWKGLESYHPCDFADLVDEILKALIERGKALEINSAGLKYGLGFAHPEPSILRRYRELGGELITIGSDGHKPEHLAYDFEYVNERLKQAGFTYYAVFENRKPVMYRL